MIINKPDESTMTWITHHHRYLYFLGIGSDPGHIHPRQARVTGGVSLLEVAWGRLPSSMPAIWHKDAPDPWVEP